jgi:uncharacterized protein (UPF0332 family)
MSHAKNKVMWCIKKAEKELAEGKKHRGLVKGNPNLAKAENHVIKADHNLKVTLYLKDGGYSDWCSSTLFYVMYHCFLAILAKHGYETRNQECTFSLIRSFIEDGVVTYTTDELEAINVLDQTDAQESDTVVDIREHYQYSTKLTLKDETYQELLEITKNILHKTKLMIQED